MILSNVGEINSIVLGSDNLTSIAKLRIESAGVRAVAEEAFSSFVNLTKLSLKQNQLTEMNPAWFAQPRRKQNRSSESVHAQQADRPQVARPQLEQNQNDSSESLQLPGCLG